MALADDTDIINCINQSMTQQAMVRIQWRQMRAAEKQAEALASIADSIERLTKAPKGQFSMTGAFDGIPRSDQGSEV